DTIEWQGFAKKDIVHSTCAVDLDLQPRVLAAAELVNAVGDDIRWTPELVRNNSFRRLRIDPENCFCRIQRTVDVRDPHLVFFEIVRETAGTSAFVPSDMDIFASDRALGEMNPGISAVHPCSAKPSASQSDGAVALPTPGIAIGAANCHPNCRRTLPLPFPQKLVCLRNERACCLWRYRALKVYPKIVGGVEEVRPELAGLMTHAQVPNQSALAIPGKIRAELRKRHLLVGELSKSSMSNHVRSKLLGVQVY